MKQQENNRVEVSVLLSTYNGERYLEEQLDSILRQQNVKIKLFVRDDGSTDRTVEILQSYSQRYSQMVFWKQKNIGVVNSFFALMQGAKESSPYYAFADQDDIWLPEKLERAIQKIQVEENHTDAAVLYCSNTILIDENGSRLKGQKIKKPRIAFGNALIENIATGCTCVWNEALLNDVVRETPSDAIMHDWWLYLTATYLGTVIYDTDAYLLYRQHSNNVVGAGNGFWKRWIQRVKRFRERKGAISKQAKQFRKIFGIQQNEKGKLLNWVSEYRDVLGIRFRILFCKSLFRQEKIDQILFKILFLFGLR